MDTIDIHGSKIVDRGIYPYQMDVLTVPHNLVSFVICDIIQVKDT